MLVAMQASLRSAVGVLVLLLSACSRENPAFDEEAGDETLSSGESAESGKTTSTTVGDGDGDPSGDGDGSPMTTTTTTTGDGDGAPTTSGDGDGDPTTTGDGDGEPMTTGDGDGAGGDGDGAPAECGNGFPEPGEQCDDGNNNNDDGCSAECLLEMIDPVMCPIPVEPMTCIDCVNLLCCSDPALVCLENVDCMCAVDCMINNNGTPQECAMMCGFDPNIAMMLQPGAMCMATLCADFCAG
jgi:cysteine-rich repeat protein